MANERSTLELFRSYMNLTVQMDRSTRPINYYWHQHSLGYNSGLNLATNSISSLKQP